MNTQAEQLLQAIVSHALDGIVTIDEKGMIQTFNPAAERIFGFTAAEAVGRDVRILMPEPHRSAHGSYIENYLRTGEKKVLGFTRELVGQRKNGELFPMELEVNEYFISGNRGFVGIVRDITERKEMEAQLLQAQKMEAIGLLAGGIAHDFNNVLTIILGYADMALAEIDAGHPLRELVKQLSAAGKRGASLVNQLLAFSRRQVLEPVVLSVNEVVTSLKDMLHRVIGEDIELSLALDPNVFPVYIDPSKFEQVVINLAVNARDAMPRGGRLTIETCAVELHESYVESHPYMSAGKFTVLTMTDTGCGMDSATRARIFEPFFTTKGTGKGTGLGLAIVFGIIKQSGGHIQVYSEVDHGTTFKIYLPCALDERRTNHSVHSPAEAMHGTETVLLAEDDEMVRRFTVRALRSYGYQVLESASGVEALKIAEEHEGPIHLLVTDVVMPRMSGRELAEAVTATRPGIKILFLSGYPDDAVIRHGILKAQVAFLQKPFAPAVLARKVREVLDTK